ncbi:MAG: hypothetical protein RIT45_2032 [Pseudomonadota bacterium]
MRRALGRVAIAALCVATLAAGVAGAETPTRRVVRGVAHAKGGKGVAYTQREVERWQEGKRVATRVDYRDAKGNKIGFREVRMRGTPLMPEEIFEDLRTGMRAESRPLRNGRVEVVFRSAKGEDLDRKSFKPDLPPVNGAGVVEAIRAHWGRLMAGGRVDIALIVPERLDWYHFRIRKVGTRKRGSHDAVAFVLEPSNPLLRAVAGQLHFELDAVSGGLVRYEGRVDLADEDGDPFRIAVAFPAELPGERPAVAEPRAAAGPGNGAASATPPQPAQPAK